MSENRTQYKKVRLYRDTGKHLKQVEVVKDVATVSYNPDENLLTLNGRIQIDLSNYDGYAVDK